MAKFFIVKTEMGREVNAFETEAEAEHCAQRHEDFFGVRCEVTEEERERMDEPMAKTEAMREIRKEDEAFEDRCRDEF